MKVIFFVIFSCLLFTNSFSAEIIDNILREEKKFGDWTVLCEEDVMMENINCQVFTTFYNDSSSVYIQPNNKIANQVVIMIPSVLENTNVKVKIDKNNLIVSDIIDKRPEYGVIPFSPAKQKLMLSQLKDGQDMFIRFTVRDLKVAGGMKEITARISLTEFSKLLVYYDIKMGNNRQWLLIINYGKIWQRKLL